MDLGKKLKEERMRRKLSLRDAAALIGISHTYLSALEKGYDPRTAAPVMPSQDVLMKLCKAYELDVAEIIPTFDLRGREELYEFVAREIAKLRETDAARYVHLLDIITGAK